MVVSNTGNEKCNFQVNVGNNNNQSIGNKNYCDGFHSHSKSSYQIEGEPNKPIKKLPQAPNISMRINGMDCMSCIQKIETALSKIDGVSNIEINFTSETLQLTLSDNTSAKITDIEKMIKNLGFETSNVQYFDSSINATEKMPFSPATPDNQSWWQASKGKQVIVLGILMAFAYVLSLIFPVYTNYIFTLAVIIALIPFIRISFSLATSGSPFSIETLMTVASLGALVIGAGQEAAAVVFLFSLGELLESLAAHKARSGIKALQSLLPQTAILVDSNVKQHTVLANSLKINDIVLIRPGDKVPTDGKIIEGESSFDESPITGESIPLQKSIDDKIFAGSINIDGTIKIRVEKISSDNTIARVVQLVEKAQSSKAPTARFIEEFSRYYTPLIMVIAGLIMIVPPLFMGENWGTWLYRGLALLLIACPCALVLSTPAAIASGLAVATRRGILIKGGNALETIGKVSTIAFDKTGTLTEGKPQVTKIVAFNENTQQNILMWAAGVESGSNHPLAKAIVKESQDQNIHIPVVTNASATAGKAAHATIDGKKLSVGSPSYASKITKLTAEQRQYIEELENKGNTVTVLLNEQNSEILGIIALRDEPRKDAQQAIAELKKLGIRSVMLTGDNNRTATAIAKILGMASRAELLPQDKLDLINQMKTQTKVAMVGDGINDAPALATADIGIAIGGGTDVALETADAALLRNQIIDLSYLVTLSRATMRNIYQNVSFSLGFKAVFIISSILGITGLWVAVLADTGATAIVTINALRLLRFNPKKENDKITSLLKVNLDYSKI